MLHETICNDDFQRNIAFQYWNNVATIRNNVATMPQCCVARKVVVANRNITFTYHSMSGIYLHSRGARGHAVVMVNDPFSDLPFSGSEESM